MAENKPLLAALLLLISGQFIFQSCPVNAMEMEMGRNRTTAQSETQKVSSISLEDCITETLREDPQIELSRLSLETDKNTVQSARSIFDPILRFSLSKSKEYSPYTFPIRQLTGIARQISLATQSTLSMSQLLPCGIIINPSISVQRSDTEEDRTDPYYRGNVQLAVTVPLIKNRKKEIVSAQLDASKEELESSRHQHVFSMSGRVYSAIRTFWNYMSAEKRFNLSLETESMALQLVDETKQLIRAGERPAAEMDQLEAYLSDKRSSRISAQQSFLEARHALAMAIGRRNLDSIETIGSPEGDFPLPGLSSDSDTQEAGVLTLAGQKANEPLSRDFIEHILSTAVHVGAIPAMPFAFEKNGGKVSIGPGEAMVPESIREQLLIRYALIMRQDLASLHRHLKSAKKLLLTAENNVKPDLNLNVKLGYTGMEQGHRDMYYIDDALSDNVAGLNTAASLDYSWPTYNNAAEAALESARIRVRQIEIQIMDLEGQIISAVRVALDNLNNSIKVLKETEKTIKSYETALNNEKKKVGLGMATILDVINTQDRYTNALQLRINSRYAYSLALADLRYKTGTIFTRGAKLDDVNFADPRTPPSMTFKSANVTTTSDPEAIAKAWILANVPFSRAEVIPDFVPSME
ncbi:MAG: hypothetical protein CVV64_04730 [Candidatus Wallbacteria bacterium HGW-Wallbacteria-1]|jgi:outer membrane protein TolC|uniref:TolC family protein n=1 Tax=Candidatus Wallbacteria bacterium HGW-Wallbacteria-1 TaxID=2013854 RepID=A0A2N1PRW1_9BACT|nr:MAG: hypothetical protein CVV64_04730 [Candidatus Wallbacteria bacterium HGW-Wallbacteria-1]